MNDKLPSDKVLQDALDYIVKVTNGRSYDYGFEIVSYLGRVLLNSSNERQFRHYAVAIVASDYDEAIVDFLKPAVDWGCEWNEVPGTSCWFKAEELDTEPASDPDVDGQEGRSLH